METRIKKAKVFIIIRIMASIIGIIMIVVGIFLSLQSGNLDNLFLSLGGRIISFLSSPFKASKNSSDTQSNVLHKEHAISLPFEASKISSNTQSNVLHKKHFISSPLREVDLAETLVGLIKAQIGYSQSREAMRYLVKIYPTERITQETLMYVTKERIGYSDGLEAMRFLVTLFPKGVDTQQTLKWVIEERAGYHEGQEAMKLLILIKMLGS